MATIAFIGLIDTTYLSVWDRDIRVAGKNQMVRIVRIDQNTGEIFVPYRFRDGRFRVADPRFGNKKHHAENQMPVSTEEELVALIRRGFHCRMRGERSGQVNLIRPEEIVIDGFPDHSPKIIDATAPRRPADLATSVSPPPSYLRTAAVAPIFEGSLSLLPAHGRISCGRCFSGKPAVWGHSSVEEAGWRLDNNPMAWGGRNPCILVLGFSKGPRQSEDLIARKHEDIAFAGGRKNLAMILETLGVLPFGANIDRIIADPDGDFAFGSFVRCSVSKFDKAKGVWLKTGKDIMASCVRDPASARVVQGCAEQFLGRIPARLTLVIMLGNDMRYIEGCRETIAAVRPGIREFNEVAYRDSHVMFLHTVHFAAQGAVVPNWCSGMPGLAASPDSDQPRKRELAIQAAIASGVHRPGSS